jgi:hypothetical protein
VKNFLEFVERIKRLSCYALAWVIDGRDLYRNRAVGATRRGLERAPPKAIRRSVDWLIRETYFRGQYSFKVMTYHTYNIDN